MRLSVALHGASAPFLHSIECPEGYTVLRLIHRAEAVLGRRLSVLISPAGNALPQSRTLEAAGLADGDVVTALAPPQSLKLYSNDVAFVAAKGDGSVVAWGNVELGGDVGRLAFELSGQVRHVYGTKGAFAAVKGDHSVVVWGHKEYGGVLPWNGLELLKPGVHSICTTSKAFAAVLMDKKTIICWGDSQFGGELRAEVQEEISGAGGVVQLYATESAFAALTVAGSVVAWGDRELGGNIAPVKSEVSSDVQSLCASYGAFAALRRGGSVVIWGNPSFGGFMDIGTAQQLTDGVVELHSTSAAFLAVKSDGSCVVWGHPRCGGDPGSQRERLAAGGVREVTSNFGAFAVIKADGSVVVFGNEELGGAPGDLQAEALSSGGITSVVPSGSAFAALKDDGSVIAWGLSSSGGCIDFDVAASLASDVQRVYATEGAFAALKGDGTVVTWGDPAFGGDLADARDLVQDPLFPVLELHATKSAFAAVRSDMSVITWGDPECGGDSSAVADQLMDDALNVYKSYGLVPVALANGSIRLWGWKPQCGTTAAGDDSEKTKTAQASDAPGSLEARGVGHGAQVLLVGLSERQELNGRRASLVQPDGADGGPGRWQVACDNQTMVVEEANLLLYDAEGAAQAEGTKSL